MSESFSETYGYEQPRSFMQIESMDDDLRNRLWNSANAFLDQVSTHDALGRMFAPNLGLDLWDSFFKKPTDKMPRDHFNFMREVRAWFMKAQWNKVYDFLQFLANVAQNPATLIKLSNWAMQGEMAGYRFIEKRIVPIVSPEEIRAVESAVRESPRPVSTHLQAALALLSDRTDPNYRKTVDESISAVEAAVRDLTGNPKATLGEGLKKLDTDAHPAFVKALDKLYGYTSDEGGIRHSLTEGGREIDADDAKYMLVSCSAFVNYLRAKSRRELR